MEGVLNPDAICMPDPCAFFRSASHQCMSSTKELRSARRSIEMSIAKDSNHLQASPTWMHEKITVLAWNLSRLASLLIKKRWLRWSDLLPISQVGGIVAWLVRLVVGCNWYEWCSWIVLLHYSLFLSLPKVKQYRTHPQSVHTLWLIAVSSGQQMPYHVWACM